MEMSVIGLLIVSVTLGYMYSPPIGFLALGAGLIVINIIVVIFRTIHKAQAKSSKPR